jgi:hypothetical protein
MKNNFIYLIIYITLIILIILFTFYIIEILSFISRLPLINTIFGDFRDYVFGMKQPAMIIPNISYRIINFYPLHMGYYLWLAIVTMCVIIILLLWIIGVTINKIVFFIPNPFAQISPWKELNEMGFFVWFFEKTFLDKNKDVQIFVLDIFKSVLTPEQYKEAQQRCTETFVDKEKSVIDKETFVNKEKSAHIDYDFSDKFLEDKKNNIFYTNSFKSIKHREEADKYRTMKIALPIEDITYDFLQTNFDMESTIKTNIGYINI